MINESISVYTVAYQYQIQRWKLDKEVKDAPALSHFVLILFLIQILNSSKKQD